MNRDRSWQELLAQASAQFHTSPEELTQWVRSGQAAQALSPTVRELLAQWARDPQRLAALLSELDPPLPSSPPKATHENK